MKNLATVSMKYGIVLMKIGIYCQYEIFLSGVIFLKQAEQPTAFTNKTTNHKVDVIATEGIFSGEALVNFSPKTPMGGQGSARSAFACFIP